MIPGENTFTNNEFKPELIILSLVEKLSIHIAFSLEALKLLDHDYVEHTAVMIEGKMIMVDMIKQQPEIEEAKKSLSFCLNMALSYLMDQTSSKYRMPLQLEQKEEGDLLILHETTIQELIFFTDSQNTALVSIVDLLNKGIAIIDQNEDIFINDTGMTESKFVINSLFNLFFQKLLEAKILLHSLTYKLD